MICPSGATYLPVDYFSVSISRQNQNHGNLISPAIT